MMMTPSISRARLRQMATGGTASIGVGVAATNLLRIVSSMTLTRLLDSSAYGVVGIIMTIALMVTMLSEIGLGPFVLRHAEGDDPTFLDQLWTIRILRAVLSTAAMAALAYPMAALLGKPEIGLVVAVWSLTFIIDGLQSMAWVTAMRQKLFWRLSMLDVIAAVAAFLISLAMALVLRSYWALIIGMFGASFARLIASYTLFPQPRRKWRLSRPRFQELWGFSRYLALSSALTLLIMESDKIVLARLLPLEAFGLYSIAVTLAVAPASLATPYAWRVLSAIYSETARTYAAGLRQVFYDARRRVVLLYMFATGGLLGGAPTVVALLYDPRYAGVVPFLRLITISVVLKLPSLAADQVLIAVGRTKANLHGNICRVAWLAMGGAIGLATGNILLLVAIVGTVEVPGLLCNYLYLRREGLLDLTEEGYGFAAAAAGIAIGYAGSAAVLAWLPTL